MNIILFDTNREIFYPLSYTRPIAEFRIGILTIKEKWKMYYKNVSIKTTEYLSKKYPIDEAKDNLWINATILPNKQLVTELKGLRKGELLKKDDQLIAFRNTVNSQKSLNHIKTILSANDGSIVRGIAFNAKNTPLEAYLNMSNKKRFNIVGKIKLNEWRGKKNIEFEIEDISIN